MDGWMDGRGALKSGSCSSNTAISRSARMEQHRDPPWGSWSRPWSSPSPGCRCHTDSASLPTGLSCQLAMEKCSVLQLKRVNQKGQGQGRDTPKRPIRVGLTPECQAGHCRTRMSHSSIPAARKSQRWARGSTEPCCVSPRAFCGVSVICT